MSDAVPATGVGSLPHRDALEACSFVLDAMPELPHLPELPRRGRGSDAVGRSAALLVDLPVETVADGWQVAARPGVDVRSARQMLDDDLAALAVAAHGYSGPLKVQVCGPVTLAAALRRSRGEAAVADEGLLRDITESLAEGVAQHLADVHTRVPGARLVLQVDEPSLPAALAGRLPTRSGWGRVAPLEHPLAEDAVRAVLRAHDGESVVHCCAPAVPWALLREAGATGIGFDLAFVGDDELDAIGVTVDAGQRLWVGAVPTTRSVPGKQAAGMVRDLWARLGFGATTTRAATVVTPACGLAGVTTVAAAAAYRSAREAAARLTDDDLVAPGE